MAMDGQIQPSINDLWVKVCSPTEQKLLNILFFFEGAASLYELEKEMPHSTLYGKKGLITRL